MRNKLNTTGKTKAMRRMENATLVITKIEPKAPATDSNLTPVQKESIALRGTLPAKRF
jgi:hypothetical protein